MPATAKKVTELTVAERALQALSIEHTETDLKSMAGKYKDVTVIKDSTDYQLVKRGGIELGKVRVSIEKAGKAARDDANKFRNAVIAEEKRLKGIITPEEDRLKALRKAVDDEEARKAEEARLIEQRRIADITERIQAIKRQTEGLLGADSTAIQMRLDAVSTIVCNEALFAEFVTQAAEVKHAAVTALQAALAEREDFEKQQAEAARIAEEQAKRQAELDRQAEEQRNREAEAQAKIDAENTRLRAEQEAIEQKRLAAERAEAAKVKVEKDRLEREAREREESERLKAEQEAEAARQDALRPEKDRLIDWLKKLRFIDGVKLHDKKLIAIQSTVLKALDLISKDTITDVENA